MKISGTGPKPSAGSAEGATKATEAGETSGKTFADAIDKTSAGAATGASGAAAASKAGAMADIAADLSAGRISHETAIAGVIDRVLDRQVGTTAAAGVREQVGAALRRALEEDPLLVSKLQALDG